MIDRALDRGLKDFIGGNCTVSLMLMAMDGLFRADLIEWMTSMTYQAASGGGAKHMRELVSQMGLAHASVADLLADPASSILDIDRELIATQRGRDFPVENFEGFPLAGSLLPWIDADLGNGQSREEWKAEAEGNKILGRSSRPDSDRWHLRARRLDALPQPGADGEAAARRTAARRSKRCSPKRTTGSKVVPNEKNATLRDLTPTAVTGTLDRAGRPPEEAVDGWRLPAGVHRWRSAALGCGRAAATDAAHHRRRAARITRGQV